MFAHVCKYNSKKTRTRQKKKYSKKKINSKVWDNHKYSREISFFIRLRN